MRVALEGEKLTRVRVRVDPVRMRVDPWKSASADWGPSASLPASTSPEGKLG